MTYRELLYKAQRLINNNEITLGEYDEMTKPLDEEVRKVGKWITSSDYPDRLICEKCKAQFDMWHWEQKQMRYCPNCGVEMRGAENE